jgi:GT2 family glycosyltransferase
MNGRSTTSTPVGGAEFAVVICTRNRPEHLARTLAALDAQTFGDFPTTVIDQSDEPNPELQRRQAADPSLTVIRDRGRGLSRARNLGWRAVGSEWIAFVDDDCLPAPDWAEALRRALAEHPEASVVSGDVRESNAPPGDYVPVALSPVREERIHRGRWTRPHEIGIGVCMAIRSDAISEVGGWDERLGAGAPDFRAGEEIDFNYRLLRAGGIGFTTPKIRAVHDQWRTTGELGPLWRDYTEGAAAFAMKHLRSGDVVGGMWLWCLFAGSVARRFLTALGGRSALGVRLTGWKLRGLAAGTVKGIARSW